MMGDGMKFIRELWCILLVASLAACMSPLQRDLNAALVPPNMEGVRWGVMVSDLDGGVLYERRADERFLPASNTKLFPTAAAFHWQEELDALEQALRTRLVLVRNEEGGAPDLILTGQGDVSLQDGPDCVAHCLAYFADAVVAAGVTEVGDIVADDRWFPEERWPGGWSWEDLQTGYGTAVSSLVVNDNTLELVVSPGETPGAPAIIYWSPTEDYYGLVNEVVTADVEKTRLGIEKLPGQGRVRVYGEVKTGDSVRTLKLGVYDPAHMAAWRLQRLLEARGVTVTGAAIAEHQAPSLPIDTAELTTLASAVKPDSDSDAVEPVFTLALAPWRDMAMDINKKSQNLYAEVLLRQLGHISAGGEADAGLERIEALLMDVGVGRNGYDLFDGSGMSVYNRVSPRTLVELLVYAHAQAWGQEWRETFPIGGVDGGLKRRFIGTPLEGRIFAKTGTLKGTNALSGYMIAKSGRMLAFSIIANERPLGVRTAVPFMDAALVRIAEAY